MPLASSRWTILEEPALAASCSAVFWSLSTRSSFTFRARRSVAISIAPTEAASCSAVLPQLSRRLRFGSCFIRA
ncbi:hypothetical protein BJY01DRAFT_216308 [Aspergillus pseudoustus]|uniref:Secreted protein n=1 Tax=Aspergillus pseudoustus TaxID=1810923 RepID=A0ABR4JUI9_9EURO